MIHVFLIEDNESLRDGLAKSVNLRGVTSAFNADAHIDTGEPVAARKQDRLKRLVSKDFWLNELDRDSVDLDQSSAPLAVSDGQSICTDSTSAFSMDVFNGGYSGSFPSSLRYPGGVN